MEVTKLADLGTVALALLTFPAIIFVFVFMNNMLPKDLAAYPYFMLFHFIQHQIFLISNLFMLTVFLSKSRKMRISIFKEVTDKISTLMEQI